MTRALSHLNGVCLSFIRPVHAWTNEQSRLLALIYLLGIAMLWVTFNSDLILPQLGVHQQQFRNAESSSRNLNSRMRLRSPDFCSFITSSVPNYRRFGFSRYIDFIMYLNIMYIECNTMYPNIKYIEMHNKSYISRKAKASCNLNWKVILVVGKDSCWTIVSILQTVRTSNQMEPSDATRYHKGEASKF
jgi:hypothetical protein